MRNIIFMLISPMYCLRAVKTHLSIGKNDSWGKTYYILLIV